MADLDIEKKEIVVATTDAPAVDDGASSTADYDALGVEVRGIAPVPLSKREKLNPWGVFTMWMSSNMVVSSFATGMLGSTLFYLNFRDGLLLLIFFNILGILPPAIFSTFGPKLGMRQMVLTRYSFGYYGTYLISLLNIIACLGWSAVNVVVGGQVINGINSNVPIEAGIAIIAVLTTIVAIFGYKVIHHFERFAWIPMLFIFLCVLGLSAQYWYTDSSTPSDVGDILSFGGTIYGFATGWTSYAADYNAYQPPESNSVVVFILTFLGLFIPLFFVELIGFGVALAAYNNDDYAAANGSTGGILSAVLAPWGGFGKFLMVLIALSIVANNVPNDYSLGLSMQTYGRFMENIKRIWWTLFGAVIYIIIAIVSVGRFTQTLDDFLLVVGYWLAAYASIVLCDHFVFRRGKFDSYDISAWDTPSALPSGIPAVIAFLAGIAGAVLGMSEVWYIGVVALDISQPYGGDIGFELSFGFSFVVYLILRSVELKFFTKKE
ncbi:purine-cytosine permease [Cladochytrium tenue]|nr:purine-cytosine permease [Cladochytrium tenue]